MHETNKNFLFVSTSNSLNNLYKKNDINEVLFISDISLASLLFAYGNSMFEKAQYNSILSKSWLIQRPSSEIANGIIDRIKKMVDAGILDHNALHYFLTDKIALRDLYISTLADSENFNFKVKKMFENYIDGIVKTKTDEIIKEKDSKIKLLNIEIKNSKQDNEKLLADNTRLKNEQKELSNNDELKDSKILYLEKNNNILLNEKNDNKKYIANFESSIRKSSNMFAMFIIGLIVLLFSLCYIFFLYKLVIPEVRIMFPQSPLYTVFGVIPILSCGGLVGFFYKKILVLYKNISNFIYIKRIKHLKNI